MRIYDKACADELCADQSCADKSCADQSCADQSCAPPQQLGQPARKIHHDNDDKRREKQLLIIGDRPQQLRQDSQTPAADEPTPDRVHAADDRVGEHEDRRQHAKAVGVKNANSRGGERAGEGDGNGTDNKCGSQIAANADPERLGRDLIAGCCLQILAERPTYHDRHSERHQGSQDADDDQKIAVVDDFPAEDFRARNVNAFSAAGQPCALADQNDADALEDERHHREVVAAKPGSRQRDQPAARGARNNRQQQRQRIGRTEVQYGQRRRVGADRHDGSGSKRDAAGETDEDDEGNPDQHRHRRYGDHILRVAVELEAERDTQNNENCRAERREVQPPVRHCARPFPGTDRLAATSTPGKAAGS